MDCLEAMREMPDNAFELAIVDVPYGIGEHGKGISRHKGFNHYTVFEPKEWDYKKPSEEYFQELFRVSENQIIWGANYFAEYLPSRMGWIFWDKLIGGDFSDGELAFTSFNRALKKFTKSIERNRATNLASAQKWKRIHPCQKPVALYKWLLTNYAKAGDTILDTHLGSGSSRIAAYDLGFDFYGFELDRDYYEAQEKRFAEHLKQPKLFEPEKMEAVQDALFG